MRGQDILILANTGTDAAPVWDIVGGQRSATVTEENETIDMTSKDSGGAMDYDYGLYSWNISCDGVYVPSETAYAKLRTAMRAKEAIKVRLQEDGENVLEGNAVITSMEWEGPYDAEATYSLELQGTGRLTVNPV